MSALIEEGIQIARAMQDMEDFDAVIDGAVENQVAFKIVDAEGAQLAKPRMAELAGTTHARHPRQLVESGVHRFQKGAVLDNWREVASLRKDSLNEKKPD